MEIDLNCDLGEGCANDADLMKYISSANIACGAHAGDLDTMRRTIDLALEHNVAIGAHPSYPDRENFGRRSMTFSRDELSETIHDQLDALVLVVAAAGARLAHVKPHGALYNDAARDERLARSIAETVFAFDRELLYVGLAGSVAISAAKRVGLTTVAEGFADRSYMPDGSLTPRSVAGSLIDDPEQAASQALNIVQSAKTTALTGKIIDIKADSICIHGDGPQAVEFAIAIRARLNEHGISIVRPKMFVDR